MTSWPLGVFASIDEGLGVQLGVAHELGVPTIHLHTPGRAYRTPEHAARFQEQLRGLGIEITCVFAGFAGESYADIPTVLKTVGLAPAETRAERTAELRAIAHFAHQLGVRRVGLHLGFVPHEATDATFVELVRITRKVCDELAERGQSLHLETGQEPADVLLEFLTTVARPNLAINFDPANMILYGCGEPLPALRKLGDYVRSVHCKDAKWSVEPGEIWGVETAIGAGDVNFPAFLQTLRDIGYAGPLTIEREIPQEPARQKAEIGGALELLRRIQHELS